jgi:hypothetical protein
MSERHVARPKLLFLVSADHGELSNALNFLLGQDFDAVLVLPEALYSLNKERLPMRARPYRTGQEALDAIADEAPALVFLFSGYLYAINKLFDIDMLERLVSEQRHHGRSVVTTDPFLGLLRTQGAAIFSHRHPRREWLVQHFSALARVLADAWHLYLTPTGDPAGKSLSFFNRHVLIQPRANLATRQHWLFVLSLEDYGAQVSRFGKSRFDDVLANLVRQTIGAGCQAILIVPEACRLTLDLEDAKHVVRAAGCSHEQYSTYLLEAEYAFFWNVFSNSTARRLINRRPVFFFDAGHITRAMPPLWHTGIAHYFAGAEPDILDAQESLVAAELAALASRQDEALQCARENIRASLPPDEVVARALGG